MNHEKRYTRVWVEIFRRADKLGWKLPRAFDFSNPTKTFTIFIEIAATQGLAVDFMIILIDVFRMVMS